MGRSNMILSYFHNGKGFTFLYVKMFGGNERANMLKWFGGNERGGVAVAICNF